MRGALACGADSRPTFPTHDFEGVLRVDFVALGDEFPAGGVRAEDSLGPGGAELQDGFHEIVLIFAGEEALDDGGGDGAATASWWHLGFVCASLRDQDP